MTTRDGVIACIRNIRAEIESDATSLNEDSWPRRPGDAWTADQILAHIASTIGNARFILAMARAGGGDAPQPADWGNPLWNANEVAVRAGASVDELLSEIRAGLDDDVRAVSDASDDLLAMHFEAPWGPKGSVADVIVASTEGHLGSHIQELRQTATLEKVHRC
jgi:hypothetical protein